MISTLLAPKPTWLTVLFCKLAVFVALFGGIHAGLNFWGIVALMVQLLLGGMVLTLAVLLTSQHTESAKSGLSAIIGGLVCVHALALVVGTATSA